MNRDSLYQLLECPVCYTPMKPPIRQCKTGHTFCDSCRQRITSCPICRGNISSSRAFHLEMISQKTVVCEKCNNTIPLHSSLTHKDTCLNGSGDTDGEKVDTMSELNDCIRTIDIRGDNFINISSESSISSCNEDFPDQEDCIIIGTSSENNVTSSDDDQNNRIDTSNWLNYVPVSSCEDEDNFSNGEYDAGNDGDESGEADSSLDEEEDVEEEEDDDYESDDSGGYEEEEDVSEDDDTSEEEDEIDEEEDEVSENSVIEDPDSYYSDDGQQTSDDTSGECDSSDPFFTTDEFDVSD